jgi:hypothetical protein
MPKKRRNFNAEFKTNVVLELIAGKKSIAEASREYNIKDTVLSRWKREFLSKATQVFEQPQDLQEKAYYREKVKTLCGGTDVTRTRPCENRVWHGIGAAAKRSCRGWQPTTRQGPAGNPGINLVHPRSSLNILYSK